MAKCRSCGELTDLDICPQCGLAPGPQTITDIYEKEKKRKPDKQKSDRKKGSKADTCPYCNTEMPGPVDICPKCGKSPGPQTITDITG